MVVVGGDCVEVGRDCSSRSCDYYGRGRLKVDEQFFNVEVGHRISQGFIFGRRGRVIPQITGV